MDARLADAVQGRVGRDPGACRAHYREPATERGRRILVGFAAETDRLAENARQKLARKGADIIVANDVTQEGAGFDTDTNIATLFIRDAREIPLPKMTKLELANRILDQVLELQKS